MGNEDIWFSMVVDVLTALAVCGPWVLYLFLKRKYKLEDAKKNHTAF